jgi:hypothetical protein
MILRTTGKGSLNNMDRKENPRQGNGIVQRMDRIGISPAPAWNPTSTHGTNGRKRRRKTKAAYKRHLNDLERKNPQN